MTQTALVSPGSVALSTPEVGHYVDASLPLVNWSLDSELGFSSLEREEVVGTCFAAVVVAAAAVAVVAAVVVVAAVEEVYTTVVVVAAAD